MKRNKCALTDAKIRGLTPDPNKQYEIWDEKISGFGCRVSPGGSKAFVLTYRNKNGLSRRMTLGRYPLLSLSEARKKAFQNLSEVAKGNDPASEKKDRNSDKFQFAAIVDEFIELYAKPRNRSWRETERILKRDFVSRWAKRDIREIGKADLTKILDAIAKQYPSAANHAYRAINKLFNWAVERSVIDISPSDGLKLPSKIESRDRVLDEDELISIWFAADAMAYPYGKIIQLLILSAQRRNEVASMRWQDINFEEKIWTIPAEFNKSGRTHRIPLSDQVIKIIQSIPKTHDVLVFPARGSNKCVSGFSKWKKKIDNISGVSDWTVHDLRRTAATGMAAAKVQPHVVEKILNHSSGSLGGVAGIYNKHEYQDEKVQALQIWDKHIVALVNT